MKRGCKESRNGTQKTENMGNNSNVPKSGYHSKGTSPSLPLPPKTRTAKSSEQKGSTSPFVSLAYLL